MDRKWGFREGKLIKAEKSVKRQGEDYSDIKKKMVIFAATWMDVEMITPSEVSQEEKDKCHIDIIYM